MDVAAVARRARTENFPVASVLFPRRLRPHLRAIYGFARLVDILGDEVEGDRLAALDELERELEACYRSEPTWPVMRALAPTIHEFSLPREPFLRLIEANRLDQRISEYATWEDLREYCRHSADPVGRLVLGLLLLDRDVELVAASDDVCTGLQLVNFLQDVPRDLELGRIYLPLEDRRRFDVTALDHPSPELVDLLRFEAARARDLLAAGQLLQERIGGRTGRAVGLFARGGSAAAPVDPVTLGLGGLYLVLQAFLTGGLVSVFRRPRGGWTLRGLVHGCGFYFGRMARLSLLALAAAGLLFALNVPFAAAVDRVARETVSGRSALLLTLGRYALLLVGLLLLHMVVSHARVLLVREERLSVVLAALSSLGFCVRRLSAASGQYLVIAALGGVLLALFGLLDSWLVVVGYKTQLVALVLFEAFMAARIALRLWLLAAQVELQREPGRVSGLP
jgi:squalene synthase HpnC